MQKAKYLKIYCDGASRGNPGHSASAFVVYEEDVKIFEYAKRLGISTNNFAEYTAVLIAYEWIINNYSASEISKAVFFLDSELVSRQLSGLYKIKSKNLKDLYIKTKKLESIFLGKIFYKSISREENVYADYLVNRVLDNEK